MLSQVEVNRPNTYMYNITAQSVIYQSFVGCIQPKLNGFSRYLLALTLQEGRVKFQGVTAKQRYPK